MEQQVKKLSEILQQQGLVLTTAESCTGGMIGAAMTDLAGASSIFDRGFITYSNEAKEEMLGVSTNILNHYGAVSSQCADAMALGALEHSNADIAVSVTGIAGPGGGSEEKPIGLVYIGVAYAGDCIVKKFDFDGDRKQIRGEAAIKAFESTIAFIEERFNQ